jgi:hypothetical protein
MERLSQVQEIGWIFGCKPRKNYAEQNVSYSFVDLTSLYLNALCVHMIMKRGILEFEIDLVLLDWYGLVNYPRARTLQSTRAGEREGSCKQQFSLITLPKMGCQKFKNTAADDGKAWTFFLLYDFALPVS